jgi:GNAT superfamily N-acetyltransferase
MAGTVTIAEVPLGDPRMREFVAFHWRHYRGHPRWVPQLDGDLLGNRALGITGLLTPAHPYHREAQATHFLATREGAAGRNGAAVGRNGAAVGRNGAAAVGRVSVVVHRRFDRHYDGRFAFFGFFETVDDPQVAHALLGAAADWARARGATVLRGPGEYANVTHERQGCLIDGFDHEVWVEHTWNPPYYGPMIESFGFAKAMDYHAYEIDLTKPLPEKLARIARIVRARSELRTRPLDMNRFEDDVRLIIEVYNQAWADNWGFLPIEDWEADALVRTLKPIIDPGLIRFAFAGDRPVAVLGAFPDPADLLRPRWRWPGDGDLVRLARLFAGRRRIDHYRLMFFGIVPGYRTAGIDALLYSEVVDHAERRGYVRCDVSLLLETNTPVLHAAQGMGAQRTKTWRIYDLAL